MKDDVDVAIIGSGFSGSILAWILAKQGLSVALIDAAVHPRFAIGESSTPIADRILGRLGKTYGLTELEALSTWGGWQREHMDLACGRKRGFSYYAHRSGEPFHEPSIGDRSLLVAASATDSLADTHWYRQEVDQFFYAQAVKAGARDLTRHKVIACVRNGDATYRVECVAERTRSLRSDWVIDASGTANVLANLCGSPDLTPQLRTSTHAAFAHYRNVGSWTQQLRESGVDTASDPFDGDDAAQHHLIDGGWMWMLRFNNCITSVGVTASTDYSLDWRGYPSIVSLMQNANLVAPIGGMQRTGRLQRLFDPVIDERRLMLPTAAVTLDPIHSTGIAHALAGVDRIATIVTQSSSRSCKRLIDQYRQSVLEETKFLDQLISTAYATIDDFPRFTAACMLYFAGAIRCEERYESGETPTHLWNSDDRQFVEFTEHACAALVNRTCGFDDLIRSGLQPWNSAGLMDPSVANRYAYTATK